MAEAVSRRQHAKRYPGITDTIRNTLLQAKRQSQQTDLVDDLMQKLNSSPKKAAQINLQGAPHAPQQCQQGPASRNAGVHCSKHHPNQVSVSRQMRTLLQPSQQVLKRVLSADKVSIRMNASRLARKGKLHTAGLLGQSPAILSKKSTGYSTQSEEEALKEENLRFRELCAAEEGRLLRLEKEI